MNAAVSGFSKLSKEDKVKWVAKTFFQQPDEAAALLRTYWNSDGSLQQLHDEFIENTISNFYIPLGVAPNFKINGRSYTVPMAIEESSVVAAAAKAAKFWSERGGFSATVINTEKIGQVHFMFDGEKAKLEKFFEAIIPRLYSDTENLTRNMKRRGGGITAIRLKDKTDLLPNYYQLHASFETIDSMGANFINSCLEQFSRTLVDAAHDYSGFSETEKDVRVIMSILSNYVPNCIVRAEVSCAVEALADKEITDPKQFAEKFVQAVRIAEVEPHRAVTHNKGIMNGIDSVVIATGNDFRAVEAGIHAYAAKNGRYTALSHASVENGIFKFWLEIPLALGTVGGLTSLHPMAKFSLDLLQRPTARQLMEITAVVGLAQNFAAVKSLTTTGIQEGHMKMHLNNIMTQMGATAQERESIRAYFSCRPVSHPAVEEYLEELRQ
ncbi:MAG: hydroxymethylglutaryl-CoA reductase, degradative [Flavobacterium sp.]|nr:MAG: hydroxymethylglutaryl-CoA reductase, degradative [Flavobacterium sp.]